MLSQEAKDTLAKLDMEFPPVAIKFSYAKPEGLERVKERDAFCQFVKRVQTTGESFYTTAEDDTCFGTMILGMIDKPSFAASGQAGKDFEIFKTQAPNARLYTQIETLPRGSVNYVSFSPVATCEFDPDLVICVANTQQATILMRATSYYSGDLWESKTSPVLSCAWMYSYPYVKDKVNTITSGMGHGMSRRQTYPAGLQIISIPYGKIGDVGRALGERPWTPPALSDDPEVRAVLAKRQEAWKSMQEETAADLGGNSASLMPS